MPITIFDNANDVVRIDDRKDVGEPGDSHRKIIDNKIDEAYKAEDTKIDVSDDNILKIMHKNITTNYADHAAHVSGYYYIQMIHGTWAETVGTGGSPSTVDGGEEIGTYDSSNPKDDYKSNNDTSKFDSSHFKKFSQSFGQLATDIDIPQLNIEYESISGKARNLNYASRLHYAGDFSINYIENYNNHIIRYHESWFKYIDALKKGYIKLPIPNDDDSNSFINIPYFNAVWVVIFAPFTTNIRGLVKIMGVAPINLPIKQVIGDRSKPTMTTINQNYKSNDMLYKFFDSTEDRKNSPFYKEFITDMSKIYNLTSGE